VSASRRGHCADSRPVADRRHRSGVSAHKRWGTSAWRRPASRPGVPLLRDDVSCEPCEHRRHFAYLTVDDAYVYTTLDRHASRQGPPFQLVLAAWPIRVFRGPLRALLVPQALCLGEEALQLLGRMRQPASTARPFADENDGCAGRVAHPTRRHDGRRSPRTVRNTVTWLLYRTVQQPACSILQAAYIPTKRTDDR